jgi:dTDP-glucose 4,6-dehydratase
MKLILKLMGKRDDDFEHVNDRPGHDMRYAIDSSSTLELGWKPTFTDFEKGLQNTITWYEKNKQYWESSKNDVEKSYKKQGQ